MPARPPTSARTSCSGRGTCRARPLTTPTSPAGSASDTSGVAASPASSGRTCPRRLGGVVRSDHLLASARTLAKEVAKGALAPSGQFEVRDARARTACSATVRLRDGQRVREFLRCNPYWAAVDEGETADGLAEVLTASMLDGAGRARRRLRVVHAPGQDRRSHAPVRPRDLRGAAAPGGAATRRAHTRHHHAPPAGTATGNARGACSASRRRRVGWPAHRRPRTTEPKPISTG